MSDFSNDLSDEFEFKPLSEGLGFHNKKEGAKLNPKSTAQSTPQSAKNPLPSTQQLFKKNTFADTGTEIVDSQKSFQSPLPRKNDLGLKKNSYPSIETKSSHSKAVNEILNTLQKTKQITPESAKKVLKTPQKVNWTPTTFNFAAVFLDFLLVVAATLMCMIIALTITKADIMKSLLSPHLDPSVLLATGTLVGSVIFLYLCINRIFIGCTPGEWAYDQSLNQPMEQASTLFIGKVILRSLIIVATGVFILPLLSLIFNKDIAGKLSGTQLLKRA